MEEERAATERFMEAFGELPSIQQKVLGNLVLSGCDHEEVAQIISARVYHYENDPVLHVPDVERIEQKAYKTLEKAGYSRHDVFHHLRNAMKFDIG